MATKVVDTSAVPSDASSGGSVQLAAGVLMGHAGIDYDNAVYLLATWSRQWGLSPAEISRCVVATVSPRPDDARDLLGRRHNAAIPWLPAPCRALSAAAAGQQARRRLLQLIEMLDDAR